MSELIPVFSWEAIFVVPWREDAATFIWIALMGFLVSTACGLVGNYLILRRMALIGDAISHSVLPGIAIAFLLSQSRGTMPMFIGALAAGMLTTILIQAIHEKSRIKQDSAIGITFSCFFAIGVILISLYAGSIDLDADCVLFGEIGWVPFEFPYVTLAGLTLGPISVVRMFVVTLVAIAIILFFYKELLITSFDPALAASLGINVRLMHYGLMALLSLVIVSAFESVGAILVIAMLILPGATASLLTDRLSMRLLFTIFHAAFSSLAGIHLSLYLDSSMAPAMVVAGGSLFALAWLFSPTEGIIRQRIIKRRRSASVLSA